MALGRWVRGALGALEVGAGVATGNPALVMGGAKGVAGAASGDEGTAGAAGASAATPATAATLPAAPKPPLFYPSSDPRVETRDVRKQRLQWGGLSS